ncbi:MAG: hypothetical protein V1909_06485 [Candidatus Micrarchaeota archaeon]
MMILGIEHGEYLEVCKKPILLYLAWEIATSVLSFIWFDAYTYAYLLSTFVYFGAAAYVGWAASQRGMGWGKAILPGAVYGAVFGFFQSVMWYVLLTKNATYSKAMDEQINGIIANATAAGNAITRDDVVSGLTFTAVIFGPILFAVVFGLVAGIVALVMKLLGKAKKREDEYYGEKEKGVLESPEKKNAKPSKKFRRKR